MIPRKTREFDRLAGNRPLIDRNLTNPLKIVWRGRPRPRRPGISCAVAKFGEARPRCASSFYSSLVLIAPQDSQFVHQDLAESSFEFQSLGISSGYFCQLKHTIINRATGKVARVRHPGGIAFAEGRVVPHPPVGGHGEEASVALTAARCGHSATYEAAHKLSRAALGMAKPRRSASVTRRSDCRAKLSTTTPASQQQRERRFWSRNIGKPCTRESTHVALINGEGPSHSGREFASFVDGRARARLSANRPNDPCGDGLL